MGSVAAIILGAGSGVRLGTTVNKIYLRIAGESILVHSARAFRGHPDVDALYVVAARQEVDLCRSTLQAAGVDADGVLAGGASRHASEWHALSALAPRIDAGELELVVIHDGARPLVDAATIARTVAAAREHGGAVAALPVERPLASVHDDVVVDRCPAENLWRAQTPQAFAAGDVLEAFRRAHTDGFEGSDTAMSLERLGLPVQLVPGDERNIKVTYPADLLRAEALLRPGAAR